MRHAFALIGLIAVLPVAALADTAAPAESPAATRFVPPVTPQVLTRTVWRTLHDGKQIVVRRSYLIAFSPTPDGFAVEGSLLAVAVEVPPALEPIARIERERREAGLFPLRLDQQGLIRSGGAPFDPVTRGQGRDASQAILLGARLDNTSEVEARAFVAQTAVSGAPAPWPLDLFNPASELRSDSRAVTLPDGMTGTVTVTLAVEGRAAGGLPRTVAREVVTELAGTRRVSREEWSIAPRTGP